MFIGVRDARECPICRHFEHTVHRGDWIPHRFPAYTVVSATRVDANVHELCRCFLEWSDSAETIRARIHEEVARNV